MKKCKFKIFKKNFWKITEKYLKKDCGIFWLPKNFLKTHFRIFNRPFFCGLFAHFIPVKLVVYWRSCTALEIAITPGDCRDVTGSRSHFLRWLAARLQTSGGMRSCSVVIIAWCVYLALFWDFTTQIYKYITLYFKCHI